MSDMPTNTVSGDGVDIPDPKPMGTIDRKNDDKKKVKRKKKTFKDFVRKVKN